MRVYSFLSTLFLSILLLTFCSAAQVHAIPNWNVQIVDVNGAREGNGRICPIVVDSNSNPHIAYTSPYSDSKVTYASSNGSLWSTQIIASGNAFSLVLDANDNPHILYTGLTYASWKGSKWTSQIVDPTDPNTLGALALDSFGNPHVAYTDGQAVKYASRIGSTWNIQIVDAYSEIPFQLSLALDSNNTPYILYGFTISIPTGTGNYWHLEEVKLATWRNSNWSIQSVAHTDGFGNMVLDSKGYPHIIYKVYYPQFTGMDNSSLVYASWNGSAWNTQAVVSNVRLANVGFLALDSHDYPHISYVASDLMYASWTGTNWNTQTVDTNISAVGPCYLALDSNGNPHISYLGFSPSDYRSAYIMYATATAPTQTLPFLLLLVSTVVIIGAVVTFVYVWKKKPKSHA